MMRSQHGGVKRIVLVIATCIFVVAASSGVYFVYFTHSSKPKNSAQQTAKNEAAKTSQSTATTEINQPKASENTLATYSLTDPTSIWIIASKKYPLPKGFMPTDLITPDVAVTTQKTGEERTLRKIIAPDLKAMFTAAKADGISFYVSSGFRSESTQAMYYNNYVARDGVEAANRYSAKPGTSEHQTGLAMDISATNETCHLEQCFANTPEGKWLAQNSYKYGFVIRYPEGKESVTGYEYEPWHIRYVGKQLAGIVHDKNQTLEEYFKLN